MKTWHHVQNRKHKISQYHQRTTKPLPQVTCTEKFGEVRAFGFWDVGQTNRHTDTLIRPTTIRTHSAGKSNESFTAASPSPPHQKKLNHPWKHFFLIFQINTYTVTTCYTICPLTFLLATQAQRLCSIISLLVSIAARQYKLTISKATSNYAPVSLLHTSPILLCRSRPTR